jgi:cob(I)alamin adenosyltransferase
MGNRLSKIMTKTGDDGTTGLGDGSRVKKYDLRVQALGDVDELNAALGLLITEVTHPDWQASLTHMQHILFNVGAELAVPTYQAVFAEEVTSLEDEANLWNEALPYLEEFILPGGGRAAAQAHFARTVCRRAERSVVALSHELALQNTEVQLHKPMQQYLNRLSDALFILARCLNHAEGISDVMWASARRALNQNS